MNPLTKLLLIQWLVSLFFITVGCIIREKFTLIFGLVILADYWITIYLHKRV